MFEEKVKVRVSKVTVRRKGNKDFIVVTFEVPFSLLTDYSFSVAVPAEEYSKEKVLEEAAKRIVLSEGRESTKALCRAAYELLGRDFVIDLTKARKKLKKREE